MHSLWKHVEKYKVIVCFFQPEPVRLMKYHTGGYSHNGVSRVIQLSHMKISVINHYGTNTNCSAYHIFIFWRLGVALASPWRQFGVALASPWRQFGVALASLWGRFGVALASLWRRFGVTLASLWRRFGVALFINFFIF